eukprot:4543227-Amphidinium_carterae.3
MLRSSNGGGWGSIRPYDEFDLTFACLFAKPFQLCVEVGLAHALTIEVGTRKEEPSTTFLEQQLLIVLLA